MLLPHGGSCACFVAIKFNLKSVFISDEAEIRVVAEKVTPLDLERGRWALDRTSLAEFAYQLMTPVVPTTPEAARSVALLQTHIRHGLLARCSEVVSQTQKGHELDETGTGIERVSPEFCCFVVPGE